MPSPTLKKCCARRSIPGTVSEFADIITIIIGILRRADGTAHFDFRPYPTFIHSHRYKHTASRNNSSVSIEFYVPNHNTRLWEGRVTKWRWDSNPQSRTKYLLHGTVSVIALTTRPPDLQFALVLRIRIVRKVIDISRFHNVFYLWAGSK